MPESLAGQAVNGNFLPEIGQEVTRVVRFLAQVRTLTSGSRCPGPVPEAAPIL